MKKISYQMAILIMAATMLGITPSCSKHDIEDTVVVVNPDNNDDENKDKEKEEDENNDEDNKNEEEQNDPQKAKLLIADWKCNATNGYKKYSFRQDGTATYKTYYDKQKTETELTYTFTTSTMKLTLKDDAKGSETTYTITTLTEQELSFGGDTYVNVTGSKDEDENENNNQGEEEQSENGNRGPVAKMFRGNGTKSDPYIISDATELRKLADDVNSGIEHASDYFKMTADITINRNVLNADGSLSSDSMKFEQWIPIGGKEYDKDKYYAFKGEFDGNNHVISGLYIYDNEKTGYESGEYACFGRIVDATIKNLTVTDSYFNGSFGSVNASAAGIVAFGLTGVIESCNNYATVKGTNSGGIVGHFAGDIIACTNYGKIEGTDAGGIVGWSYGGMDTTKSLTARCVNYGDVSYVPSRFDAHVGGIVGRKQNGLLYWIFDCVNYGTIIGGQGGICGKGRCSNCVNFGNVISETGYAFGIGNLGADNVVNYGNISYDKRAAIGYDASTSGTSIWKNCYYLNTTCNWGVYGKSDSQSGCKAMSEEEMKSQTFLNELNKNAKAFRNYTSQDWGGTKYVPSYKDFSQWKFGKNGFPTLEFVEEK